MSFPPPRHPGPYGPPPRDHQPQSMGPPGHPQVSQQQHMPGTQQFPPPPPQQVMEHRGGPQFAPGPQMPHHQPPPHSQPPQLRQQWAPPRQPSPMSTSIATTASTTPTPPGQASKKKKKPSVSEMIQNPELIPPSTPSSLSKGTPSSTAAPVEDIQSTMEISGEGMGKDFPMRKEIAVLAMATKIGPQMLAEAPDQSGKPATKMGSFIIEVLKFISYLVVIAFFPLSMLFTMKIVKEYERAVIFRLGRVLSGGARGPGIFFILPCIDSYRQIDLRVMSFDVPPQELLSKDSVTVTVDAVVYFRVYNPIISVTNVNDAFASTKLLAQTTLRNALGTRLLAEMLSEREAISHSIQSMLDEATDPWGVKVERVEVKDIRLPHQMMRAMAVEAEATRESSAKVIAAEGEKKSAQSLLRASETLVECPAAMHLRYLQTLNSIAADRNHTIVFPIPTKLINSVYRMINHSVGDGHGGDNGDITTMLPLPPMPQIIPETRSRHATSAALKSPSSAAPVSF